MTDGPFDWTPEDIARMAEEEGLPVLPYADRETGRSSGWSGSDTSKERAHERDTSGKTKTQQDHALAVLAEMRHYGATSQEVGNHIGAKHGSYSQVMSALQQGGKAVRLKVRRNYHEIYVLPEYVNDRPISPYKPNAGTLKAQRVLGLVREAQANGSTVVDVSDLLTALGEKE